MKFIKKQFRAWRLVVIIGIAAIAIPIVAHVRDSAIRVIDEQQTQWNGNSAESVRDTIVKRDDDVKTAIGLGLAARQDYYDRRREYWEKRVERRMEYEDEYGDEDFGDDADKADAKDSKGTKDSKKDKESKKASKDEDDEMDQEAEMYERRREYWRERLDDEW